LTLSDPSSSVNSRAVTGQKARCSDSQGMLPEADCTSVKRRHQTTKEARGTASHYCKLARPSKYTQGRADNPSSLPSKPIGRPRRPVHPRPCRPNPRSCEQLPTQCATTRHDSDTCTLAARSTAVPSNSPLTGQSTATSGAARPCTSAASSKPTSTSQNPGSKG
jgi:hypothetical protein